MALHDPTAVYNAANNLEAAIIGEMLLSAGIEAHVVEDVSQVGAWMFGLLPEIHKPQIWIARADVDRVKPMLEEFERRRNEKRRASDTGAPIQVTCEDCEKRSAFPASRLGSVETCPHCGAFVDVGDDASLEGWDETDHVESEET